MAAAPGFHIFTCYAWTSSEGDSTENIDRHSLLPYHRDRLLSAAQAFGWSEVVTFLTGDAGLQRLLSTAEEHLKTISKTPQAHGRRKIKICVCKNNKFGVESNALVPTGSRSIFSLPVFLDKAAPLDRLCTVKLDVETTTPSLFTSHKTSKRDEYDRARRKADISHQPPDIAEVLLFNPNQEVMECSLSTPYFFRDGRWVTPPLCSGGNAGVTRKLALESRLCREQVVFVEDLRNGETFWISNGVRGFLPAILSLDCPSR